MKCTARTTKGEPCARHAIRGGRVCPSHGGRAPQVQLAAKTRLIESQATAVVAEQYPGGFPEMLDPKSRLLALASEAEAMKDVFARRVANLNDVAYTNVTGDQEIQAEIRAYLGSIDRLADILVKVNRLGIAGHGREIRAEDAQNIGRALQRVLANPQWELSHETQRAMLVAVSDEIRAIYAGSHT
jgi:hypothetical protein